MIDIVTTETGQDMGVLDTQVPKAQNILSVQLGSLEYAQDFGIDLRYFLSEDFKFQNESFKSYLIQVLSTNGINVAEVTEVFESLFGEYTFKITPPEQSGGLVAR